MTLQEQVAAIDAAIASGTLRVRYADRDVTYRSLRELKEARALIMGRAGNNAGFGVSYPKTSKGIL